MEKEQNNIDKKLTSKILKISAKIIYKTLLFLLALAVIVSLSFIFLSQTKDFRSWFYGHVLEFISENIEGKIEAADIKIMPFAGIKIVDLRIIAAGDTVVKIKKLSFKYDFMPLFNNYLNVKSLTINQPEIKLIRNGQDSTWNYEHIFKAVNDTSASGKLNWTFDIKNLTVINGRLKIKDNLKVLSHRGSFDIADADFNNINFSLTAKADIPAKKYYLNINKFFVRESRSKLDIREFGMQASIDTAGVRLHHVNLRSNYISTKFNSEISNINIFEKIDSTAICNANFKVDFNADFLDLRLLNKFIKQMPKINDDIGLNGYISGNLQKVKLKQFKIAKNKSELIFSGQAGKLFSSNPSFTINISNSNLYDNDLTKIMNGFGHPEINIGHTFIKRIEAQGDTKKIKGYFDLQSPYANLVGSAKLDMLGIPRYYADLKVEHINVGGLLSDKSLESKVSGDINVQGEGFTPKDLKMMMDLSLYNSRISDYRIDSLKLKTDVDSNMKINLKKLYLVLDNYYSDSLIQKYSDKSILDIKGRLDLSDFSKPQYDLNIDLNGFNLASLLKSYLMPQYLDTKIKLKGSGFHPDSLETNFAASVENCMFGNRALMPFSLDIQVQRLDFSAREIVVNSNLFNLKLTGEYSLGDFEYLANMQIGELVGFIDRQVKSFYQKQSAPKDSLNFVLGRRKIPAFNHFNMDLTASLHDLTPLGIAVGQPYLSGSADIEAYIDASADRSIIDLRKLSVNNFQYKDGQVKIVVNPTDIKSYVDIALVDSLSVFKTISVNLKGNTESYIDNMQFDRPDLDFNYHNDSVSIDLSTTFNKSLFIKTSGNLLVKPGLLDLKLDSSKFAIKNLFAWHSAEPIAVSLTDEGLNIKKLIFTRTTNELIKLSGLVNADVAKDVRLQVVNFPVNELVAVTKGKEQEFLQTVDGNIKKLSITLNDSLNSPTIECDFKTDYLVSNKSEIGFISGNADYRDKLLQGGVLLTDSTGAVKKLTIDLKSLPIDLSLRFGGQRILPDRPINIQVNANNLNLNLANIFIPDAINNLNGVADANLGIMGVKYDVDYIGNINIKHSRFLSVSNNLYYNAQGDILIDNENIDLKNIKITNDENDLKDSYALVNGPLIFSNFEIKHFDFTIKAKRIKLLSEASKKNMPNLFGDFVIRTKNKGVIFSGDFEHPSLKGDVEILKSHLYMPSIEKEKQLITPNFKYEIKGNNLKVENIPKDSLLTKLFGNTETDTKDTTEAEEKVEEDNKPKQNKSFSDLIKYDLNIWFFMPLQITMDVGSQFGQISAIVGTKIPSAPIHYYVDPDKNTATIIGDLELKKNSVFNYIKLFNITGDILFPTGDINNPKWDFKAVYDGKTTINERLRNYQVILYLRGTQKNPIITFDYTLDSEPAKGDSTQIREDALMLLLFGMTKSEFESPSSSGGSGFTDIGAQGIASMLSRTVTEMLSGTGFITSADIDLQGGSFQNAKLKLSGQLFGMTWKVGGTISDVMNGYEFTAEVPLGLLFEPDKFRAIFLSFMTTYNPSQNISRNQKNWEIKLKFGNEF